MRKIIDLPPCVVCTSPQELALLLVTPGASCQADAGLIMGLKEPAAVISDICTSVPDFKFQYLKLVAVCSVGGGAAEGAGEVCGECGQSSGQRGQR
jgi:hypothetical protein